MVYTAVSKTASHRDCEFESHREHKFRGRPSLIRVYLRSVVVLSDILRKGFVDNIWTGGRVVYCNGLENRRAERFREFESLPVRVAI